MTITSASPQDMTLSDMTSGISVVVPMHNEQEMIDPLFARLLPVMEKIGRPFEIVCVDDGSRDKTHQLMEALCQSDPRIKLIKLSRNFGKEVAVTAGLDHIEYEAAVIIDADLQDPPELIETFVEHWQKGFQNVFGVRISRNEDTFLKRWTAEKFYSVFNTLSEMDLPQNAGDFRLLGPDVLKGLKQLKERRRFMKGLYAWVGYPSIGVPYERPARFAGQTKFSFFKLWNFAIEGIASHSSSILRVWTYVGLFAVFCSVMMGLWLLIDFALYRENPRGFYLLTFIVMAFSSLNFVMLGIMGEYIGRIYEEVKERPLYLVQKREQPKDGDA
jgi:glycosyltransferase involved in cell wall biosynthesis